MLHIPTTTFFSLYLKKSFYTKQKKRKLVKRSNDLLLINFQNKKNVRKYFLLIKKTDLYYTIFLSSQKHGHQSK